MQEEMEPKAEMYMTDEESFMTYQKEVADGLKAIEEKVQSKFGVDQMDLLRAQNAYRDDPEVQEEMKRVRSVFFGEGDMPSADEVEVPADMTADKVRLPA
ncbi:hypothetical protein EON62_06495 [archaeon]|nr:MAG: hypothetical protein EON62_06495 [archaeon]